MTNTEIIEQQLDPDFPVSDAIIARITKILTQLGGGRPFAELPSRTVQIVVGFWAGDGDLRTADLYHSLTTASRGA